MSQTHSTFLEPVPEGDVGPIYLPRRESLFSPLHPISMVDFARLSPHPHPQARIKGQPPISPATTTSPTTSEEPSSPGFPPIPFGNLTARGIDVENTTYPMSFIRTPLALLPFPHPKWHVRPSTGEIYEVTSPIFEEYDPVTGYIGSVDEVRESVEGNEGNEILGGRRGSVAERWRENSGNGSSGYESNGWNGYVNHPESRERSSIRREAKRVREEREGEGHVGVRKSKRVRERQD